MADLHTALATLAAHVPPTTTEVVDADITRGRTAVRRRRTATIAATGLAVAAVLGSGAALTATAGGTTDPVRTPVAASGTTGTTAAAPAFVPSPGITSGPFTSQLAPAGWVVQDPSDLFGLRLIDPAQPATDLAPLTVTLLSLDATPPAGLAALQVNGQPAWSVSDDQRLPADQVPSLITELPDGRYLQVDHAAALGWTDEQIATFTAGITVAPDAPRTHG